MVGNAAFESWKYAIFIVARVTIKNWTGELRAFVIDIFIKTMNQQKLFECTLDLVYVMVYMHRTHFAVDLH